MVYVDTSVVVALHTREPSSETVSRWYSRCKDELVSTMWIVTEFASALGIKQRRNELSVDEALAAWGRFERQCANDLRLLALRTTTFHRAALLSLNGISALRSGDAIHLAAALEETVEAVATLDDVFARNASLHKLRLAIPTASRRPVREKS